LATPTALAQSYLDSIKAPSKGFADQRRSLCRVHELQSVSKGACCLGSSADRSSLAMLQRFSIWLDKKTITTLKEIGKEMERPVGWIVRKAVGEFIERRKP
jgi:hypothetical protein